MYGNHFDMGGLSGCPFGGVSAFNIMASHIPDRGSCLILYGPHIGIDSFGGLTTPSTGSSSTLHAQPRKKTTVSSDGCCLGALNAAEFLKSSTSDKSQSKNDTDVPIWDIQQHFVNDMLLPYKKRLDGASEPLVELVYALYDAQTDLMEKIIARGCVNVGGDGMISLLGGIQVNTPSNMPDFFLPLRFDVFDNRCSIIEKIILPPSRATVSSIMSAFPGARTNADLVQMVQRTLVPFGFGKSSLLCTSLCSDELSRCLEADLQAVFGDNYRMGGLSGFAFGGSTAFWLMAGHIPDCGTCLIVYGPHVGVDSFGEIGTVDRRGCENGSSCCTSGIAAAEYVMDVRHGRAQVETPTDPMDAQQAYVCEMLLPYSDQLDRSENPMIELPFALFQAQDELMMRVVGRGCQRSKGWRQIALLGGIQINTPEGVSDYFLPKRFDLITKGKAEIDNLLAQS
jgi:Limiting CO2-inducible proteins B/C beta carbonyic anhydrases